MMFFLLFKVEVTDKIYNVPQLASLSLLCSPPERVVRCKRAKCLSKRSPSFCKLWGDSPLLMVNPLPATRTKLAAFKGWGSHVEYEAVVVVGMATVNPLHMGRSFFVVHCFSRVRWKQALSTYLST